MPLYGKKYGESCVRNSDCETGFVCLEAESGRMMCAEQTPGTGRFGKFLQIFDSYFLFFFNLFLVDIVLFSESTVV